MRMRVNVYGHELTDEVIEIKKDKRLGVQLLLANLNQQQALLNGTRPPDDERSAVTFWIPVAPWNRERQARTFEKVAAVFRRGLHTDGIKAVPAGPNEHVQYVPPHCDRIIWRDRYYGLSETVRPHVEAATGKASLRDADYSNLEMRILGATPLLKDRDVKEGHAREKALRARVRELEDQATEAQKLFEEKLSLISRLDNEADHLRQRVESLNDENAALRVRTKELLRTNEVLVATAKHDSEQVCLLDRRLNALIDATADMLDRVKNGMPPTKG
jgi:hypothetical protein